ncbi:hypothetical protein B0J13DRAFT_573941 [Dactylonectria estremocensis]|uniref:Uncharacterized protein n=1 Tax=Dactylonectria estremocensis TaxID=1079267 RepID=A0A9P9IBZ2_9HYPO|nr:hypothetical protein B0J13DRAFT_573941 [Dactylonectria estremocensis]
MDDKLKIMIAGTMKTLAKQTDKSWERAEVARADKLIKESSSDFKFDGSSDAGIVRETCIKIDIDVLANIVSQTGATVDSFETFFTKDEHYEQTLIDISVLRFPDIDHPFLRSLYRIKLVAWSDSSFNSRVFRPRASVIGGLTSAAREKAIAAANAMFDD